MSAMKSKIDAIVTAEPITFSKGSEDIVQGDLHIIKKVAAVMQEYPHLGLKIEGRTHEEEGDKKGAHQLERLSLLRCREVSEAFKRDGAKNSMACVGLGFVDGGEPALTLTPIGREEAERLDADVRSKEVVTREDKMQDETKIKIVFEIPGTDGADKQDKGEQIEVHFEKKPLGFEFNTETPIKVKNVTAGSHAEEVGVKVGWIMKEVNETKIPLEPGQFREAYKLLTEAVKKLPAPDA